MADKRMFSMKIIDSDAFLDMPTSAQALYFHLSMRADDDGFVNNPKKIKGYVGAADDDLKLLIAKNFLIPFESGVVVIKHWKIHNYIQKDRYKPTTYTEERAQLEVKPNSAYTLVSNLDTECIQTGHEVDAQIRLDKIRSDKMRVVVDEDEEPAADSLIAYAANNLAYISPTNMEELDSFREDLSEDMIRYAIDEACANGKRNYAYVRTILNRMIERGFKSLDDVKAAEEERRKKLAAGQPEKQAIERQVQAAQRSRKPMDERKYVESALDDPLQMMQALMNRPRSREA